MVKYTFHYFDGRGAGEVVRQIFVVAGQEFEDRRYSMEEWPEHKASMPFGQLPVLEVDGQKLPQSFAIARYVARKFGLAGKNAWEEGQVDSLTDQWKDFLAEIKPFWYSFLGFQQGDVDALKKDVFEPAVKKHFAFFTKFLKENGSGYLVGQSVTWIDLLVSEFVSFVSEKFPEIFADFPELKAHAEKVRSIPELKQWIATRPVTPF